MVSVLLSQPSYGQWTVIEAFRRGNVAPVYYVEIGTSLAVTALLAWYMAGRGSDGRRRWREPIPCIFLAVLVGNAAISFAYAKNEIISLAGTFYAVTAFVATRALVLRLRGSRAGMIAALVLFIVSSAWAVRAAGLHFKLRQSAFERRNEWVSVNLSDRQPDQSRRRILFTRLKDDAILERSIAPALLPAWGEDLWGEH